MEAFYKESGHFVNGKWFCSTEHGMLHPDNDKMKQITAKIKQGMPVAEEDDEIDLWLSLTLTLHYFV